MIRQILTPIARRIGSFAGGLLVAVGATSDEQTLVTNAVIALVLIMGDVALSRLNFLRLE